MKTLLIIGANLGQARAYMAKTLLGAAARKTKLETIDSPSDAEMAVVLGSSIPNDSALNGKDVWLGDVSRAVVHPELFLSEAKGHAKPYATPVIMTVPVAVSGPRRVVAVTACPTDVARTFMAAEVIETGTKKRGQWTKVEARGFVGAGNAITPEEVATANLVIVTADIEMDLTKFAGKPIYRTSTGLALKKVAQELGKAVTEAAPYEPAGKARAAITEGKKESAGAYRHLLAGVSYMLPMVVAGGLCIALSFAFGTEAFKKPGTLAAALVQIGGGLAFALVVPILAGYIVFSVADRPNLTPGLIGGMLTVNTGSGFIGDIIAGFLTGHIAKLISTQLRLPQGMEALKPVLITPLISSLVVGLAMIYLIGKSVADILERLTRWLQATGTANVVLPGAISDGMMCTDVGGPVNKAAYAFGVGLLNAQTYGPTATIMAAGMVPPLAIGLTTMVTHRKFDKAQQEGDKVVPVLGLCFISEGAIPLAAHSPMHMLPCYIMDGALIGAVPMVIGAKLMAPHDGPSVLLILGAITPVLSYLVATIAGTLVAGLACAFLKHPEVDTIAKATQ